MIGLINISTNHTGIAINSKQAIPRALIAHSKSCVGPSKLCNADNLKTISGGTNCMKRCELGQVFAVSIKQEDRNGYERVHYYFCSAALWWEQLQLYSMGVSEPPGHCSNQSPKHFISKRCLFKILIISATKPFIVLQSVLGRRSNCEAAPHRLNSQHTLRRR